MSRGVQLLRTPPWGIRGVFTYAYRPTNPCEEGEDDDRYNRACENASTLISTMIPQGHKTRCVHQLSRTGWL